MIAPLPIESTLAELTRALSSGNAAVLVAPPGSGKTTRVPLALLNAPWLDGKKIVMLEPRRIAARLAAGYMAGLCGEQPGQTVGYRIRFEQKISAETRIEVITEGLLTRRLQQDPELTDVGLIIFDEFHERSLDVDLALSLSLEVQAALREDLRLLVMSATMAAKPVSRLLGHAPVIRGEGRMHPVTLCHLPPDSRLDSPVPHLLSRAVTQAIRQILEHEQGDILVFLPGIGEISRVQRQLGSLGNCVVRPLHGGMNPAAQQKAIDPDEDNRQRIILATTIAETSVTLEGITVVVDSGWKRVPRYHASTGLTGLDTVRISKASAEQRAGRAGRIAPGSCYRLWHKGVEAGLQPYDKPEILQADLSALVLELANWGVHDPAELSWLDIPPPQAVQQGKELLRELGALDIHGTITQLGRKIAGLPLHPRLATMVLRAGLVNQQTAVDLAALLSERDPLPGDESADIDQRLYCLRRYRNQGKRAVEAMGGKPAVCAAIERVSRQLRSLLRGRKQQTAEDLSTGGILALAYPDRVARRRKQGHSYLLKTGTGGALFPHDPLAASRWLVIAAQNGQRRDGRIFLAAAIEEDELIALFQDELQTSDEIFWQSLAKQVVSRRCVYLGKLIISEKRIARPDIQAVHQALLAGIRELGLDTLAWTRGARQLQIRLCCLRQWQSQEQWPDFSDSALLETMEEWLEPFLGSCSTLKGCAGLSVEKMLLSRLDYSLQQQLERDAPQQLLVPSGSRIRLEYHPEQPPILAVRLQEMFGLAETPTVCRGKIKVVLHLLSPARRPVQITQDLRAFWDSSYFEVRKELKGRYPKHHWPEKPWQAEATARVKSRKRKK